MLPASTPTLLGLAWKALPGDDALGKRLHSLRRLELNQQAPGVEPWEETAPAAQVTPYAAMGALGIKADCGGAMGIA